MQDLNRQIEALREQQASAWIAALAKPDHGQYAAFIDWLKESPLNVREYLYACSIEQGLDQLDSKRLVDVNELLELADPAVTRIGARDDDPQTITPSPTRHPRHVRWPYALAACILAAATLGWWQLSGWQPSWNEFRTGIGEQRAVQLEDGSVVYLNASSRVFVHLSGAAREVKLLDGEALFKVHHDALRPFRVFARDAVIRDIGTQFNVYSRSDGMKIAVLEGSVEVTARPAAPTSTGRGPSKAHDLKQPVSRTLVAHEQARLDNAGNVTVSDLPDLATPVAWQQGRLEFRDEALGHIVEEFNRHNHRAIRLEGVELMNRSYTGDFDADDPDSLVLVLANDPDLSVDQSGDEIIIRSSTVRSHW